MLAPAVVRLLETGEMQARSRELGAHLQERLAGLLGRGVTEVRGVGLWAGVGAAAAAIVSSLPP